MPKVIYEKDGRIGRITLNRPEVKNAIDDDVPVELADCVARANADPGVHVIVLSGAGPAFCAGYDLTYYGQASGATGVTQAMPWDPMKALGVREHCPNDHATRGQTDVETHPCHGPCIRLIRFTGRSPKHTTHIALRTDDQPDAGRK